MIKRLIFLVCVFCAGLAFRCGSGPLAGGATDSPNAIAGMIVDPDAAMASSGVKVYLYRDIARTTFADSVKLRDRAAALDSVITDSAGTYLFDGVYAGWYTIWAQMPGRSLVAYRSNIEVNDSDVILSPDTLGISVTITGVADIINGPRFTVFLAGTPFWSNVDTNGNFRIDMLPPDTFVMFTLIDYPADPTVRNIATADTVIAFGGGEIDVGKIAIETVESAVERVLYDDCEGAGANRGGVWWRLVTEPGVTVLATPVVVEEGRGGGMAATIAYRFGPEQTREALLGKNTQQHWKLPGMPENGLKQVQNLSAARGISFWIRGTGQQVKIRFHSAAVPGWNDLCSEYFAVNESWAYIELNFATDLAPTYQSPEPPTWEKASSAIDAIMFAVKESESGVSGQIWVDDIELLF